MSKQPYPSQTQDRFIVRLPDGLRDRIAAAAKANNRSMNSEIVATLEAVYPVQEDSIRPTFGYPKAHGTETERLIEATVDFSIRELLHSLEERGLITPLKKP